jgi:hypothetical protein
VYIDALAFLLKNTCVIINIIVFFTTFAAVFVKETNKNLIFILFMECAMCFGIAFAA